MEVGASSRKASRPAGLNLRHGRGRVAGCEAGHNYLLRKLRFCIGTGTADDPFGSHWLLPPGNAGRSAARSASTCAMRSVLVFRSRLDGKLDRITADARGDIQT